MRKAQVYLTVLLLTLAQLAIAQLQGANWPMQYNDLMLKITPDTFERDSLPYCYYYVFCGGPNGYVANTAISDNGGHLLLFSYGEDLRNKYGNIVKDGGRLSYNVDYPNDTSTIDGSDPHSQGALLLPCPGNNNLAYLFIKDDDSTGEGQPSRVSAFLADISINNDSGGIIRKQVILQNTLLSDSRMTACQHANGRDWWLITHQYLTNVIYSHLITQDSIYGPFEQSIGLPGIEGDRGGWSLFAPNGTVFATTTSGMGGITLLDFDRCSGVFSNFRSINVDFDTGYYYNMSFSPNSRFLYASNNNWLVQYDLQASDIAGSKVQIVHDTASFPLLGEMVLMPNGKIYQVGWNIVDSMLSVIDNADIKGLDCGFHLRSVLVSNSIEMISVPNFPVYGLGPVVGSACDTIHTSITDLSKANSQVRIEPNPVDNYINIHMEVEGNYALYLFNVVGQMVDRKETRIVDVFDTEYLANGVYFLQVRDKNSLDKIITQKVVIQH